MRVEPRVVRTPGAYRRTNLPRSREAGGQGAWVVGKGIVGQEAPQVRPWAREATTGAGEVLLYVRTARMDTQPEERVACAGILPARV